MFVSAATTYADTDRSSAADTATSSQATASSADQADQTDTPAVLVTLSQTGLDFLTGASSHSSATLSSEQEALTRLDQMIQSGRQSVKEAAEQQVNMLKAQMRLLLEMKALLSPEALVQELTQLSRQLAAAVAQYTQSGGTDAANAAVGNAVLLSPQASTQGASKTDQATASGDADPDTQQAGTETTQDNSDDRSGTTVVAAKSGAVSNDNLDFSMDVNALADQMKAILHESRRDQKKKNAESDSDFQTAQNALDTVDQLMM